MSSMNYDQIYNVGARENVVVPLLPGSYQVRHFVNGAFTSWQTIGGATPPGIPAAPTLTASTTGVTATITAVTDARSYIYRFYRGGAAETDERPDLSCFISAAPGQEVQVQVAAKNPSGTSNYSGMKKATVLGGAPPTPSYFNVGKVSDGFTPAWNIQPDDVTITLSYKIDSSGTTVVPDLAGTSTKIEGSAGQAITAKIKAVSVYGESAWTEEKSATIPSGGVAWPNGAKAELRLVRDLIKLSWNKVPSASGYYWEIMSQNSIEGEADVDTTEATQPVSEAGATINAAVTLLDQDGNDCGELIASDKFYPPSTPAASATAATGSVTLETPENGAVSFVFRFHRGDVWETVEQDENTLVVDASTTVSYKIAARNGLGDSSFSTTKTVDPVPVVPIISYLEYTLYGNNYVASSTVTPSGAIVLYRPQNRNGPWGATNWSTDTTYNALSHGNQIQAKAVFNSIESDVQTATASPHPLAWPPTQRDVAVNPLDEKFNAEWPDLPVDYYMVSYSVGGIRSHPITHYESSIDFLYSDVGNEIHVYVYPVIGDEEGEEISGYAINEQGGRPKWYDQQPALQKGLSGWRVYSYGASNVDGYEVVASHHGGTVNKFTTSTDYTIPNSASWPAVTVNVWMIVSDQRVGTSSYNVEGGW